MPPVITKQKPPKTANGPPPTLPKGRPLPPVRPDEPPSAWGAVGSIRMLLYGQSGSGKTTFWATFPGPILALVCSGSKRPGELKSIDTPEYRAKIDARIVSTTDQFKQMLERSKDYATVVLDHCSGFQDLALRELLGMEELPAQKSWGMANQETWGICNRMCADAFKTLLDLPAHIILVAQERHFGDENVSAEIAAPTVSAALTPGLEGWLRPACDYVVRTFIKPVMTDIETEVGGQTVTTRQRGKGVLYALQTGPHDIFRTKFRVPRGTPLPDDVVDPSYDKLAKLLRGGK